MNKRTQRLQRTDWRGRGWEEGKRGERSQLYCDGWGPDLEW